MNTITYTKFSNDDCKWYGVPAGSYKLHSDDRWFPTEAIMTVKNGKYVDGNNVGATISGNLGSANIAVLNIQKAISLLQSAGYSVIDNLQTAGE